MNAPEARDAIPGAPASGDDFRGEAASAPETALRYAGFWVRVVAAVMDAILMMMAIWAPLVAIYGLEYFDSGGFAAGAWDVLLRWVLPFAVVVTFWARCGATPGKMIVGLVIVDAKSAGKLSPVQCAGRFLAYFVSALPAALGFVWAGFDSRKQGWHDKLARTVVVRKSSLPRA